MFAALVFAAITIGSTPPNFPIATPHGAASLGQLIGKKPIVINFWDTWCHPCTDELRTFVKARETFGSRIAVLTVSDEPHDVAASYLRLWNIDLPVVEDLDGSITRSYLVPPVPLTVLVGTDGKVAYTSEGELTWSELEGAIEASLEGPEGAPSSTPGH
jgi:peroxiredoxin